MKGSVYWNKAGKKWVVSIRWEGKRYYIYKDKKAGTYFYNKVHAYQVLGAIQEEIKDDSFKPRTWLPESPLGLYGYSRVWLSDKDASKKTLRDYRGYIDNHIIPFLESNHGSGS